MEQKPTNELNDLLENMQPSQLDRYLKENKEYLTDADKAFYYYFKDVLYEKRRKLKDVYTFAGVSESYGSKIITMEKHTTDRDLIIRLCLAGRFSVLETDRALKLYGMNELYAKDPRDACIIVAVKNRIFDPYTIDAILMDHGFPKLTSRTEE